MALRIGIVAAEPSGDFLAAGLMAALSKSRSDLSFEGIGGPQMQAVGMDSWHPMEKLSVMGLVEVLGHLPELLKIRRNLVQRWRKNPPDIFIGVDAPDFNLTLEQKLKQQGVPTVHYVSPTVWAWRQGRVRKLKRAVDLLLSIFPFEEEFLGRHGVKAKYVGHPLASDMPLHPDQVAARAELGIDQDSRLLALLPGSRMSEVALLARPFLQTAMECTRQLPALKIVAPLINDRTRQIFEAECARYAPDLPITIVQEKSRQALTAADVVVTASGTATFEALLCKRPMIVGYKLHWLTYWLAKTFRLIKIEHVSMANLLAGEGLAPEFIQNDCEPEKLVPGVLNYFADDELRKTISERYCDIHKSLLRDTNQEAARAVLDLIEVRS